MGIARLGRMAGATRIELATTGSTVRDSNQLSYTPADVPPILPQGRGTMQGEFLSFFKRTSHRRNGIAYVPVEPKPPVPRAVSSRESTSAVSTRRTGATTS